MDYVELQVTSNFSFLRGASHPEELVEQAKLLGYRAIAISDRHSLAGVVRAHVAAKAVDLPLVVGTTALLYNELDDNEQATSENAIPLLLYPTSRAAYGRLCQLLTRGKLRAAKGSCYLIAQDVLEHEQGLVAVLPIQWQYISQYEEVIHTLLAGFSHKRLWLGISHLYEVHDRKRLEQMLALKQHFGLKFVATNDVHYHLPERRLLQDVLSCIRMGIPLEEAGYQLFPNGERYLKPPAEMARLFRKFPDAIRQTRIIAEQVLNFSLDDLQYHYPHEICPAGKTPLEYLKELTWDGAAKKYPTDVPDKVVQAIEHEFALIEELDYAKYFLTVYDVVVFARERDILCQGRGAAANSAVCYCLGITSVDPNQIDLLFERFVSKERDEPPDIDIDFEHERREEVIQYIYNKYGRFRAALVAEVVTYRTRSAVRDIGKVFGLSLECIDLLAKSVGRWSSGEINEKVFLELGLDPSDPTIHNTIHASKTIARFPRHLSQHVGGFIISDSPLSEIVPIENAAMPERTVIEWDKDDIEAMGMLKVDMLSLGMLTCIRKAFHLINERKPGTIDSKLLALHNIPADDPAVYDMICKADTVGVFQIESRAQMSMLPRLRPRCFYDLVIEVAIVRPGPIQGNMVHPFLRRRWGEEEVSYPTPEIESVLAKTLGVPIFQEQAMKLAIVGAGFTPGEADDLRRAMASWKRKGTLIKTFGERIVKGMIANGYPADFAERCFQQITGFGEYGFPESHSASFALLAYVSSWLKHYYPAHFAAALVNSQPMGFYRPAQIIRDAQDHGVEVLPVDVNHSGWDCTLEGEKPALRLGMRLVRGLSHHEGEQVAAIVKAHGKFHTVSALWRASNLRASTLHTLARADAFNSMGLTRQRALWATRRLRDEALPLFDGYEPRDKATPLPRIALKQRVIEDYEFTGLSLKAHPVSFMRNELARAGIQSAQELADEQLFPTKTLVATCGIVLVRQRPMTASGVVFVTLEDETGVVNLIVRPKIFERYRSVVGHASVMYACGRIEREREVMHLLVDELCDFTDYFNGLESRSRDFH